MTRGRTQRSTASRISRSSHLARYRIRTSSVLYILSATPFPLKSYTSITVFSPPSAGVYTSCSFPGPGARKSVARYCATCYKGIYDRWERRTQYLITERMPPNHNRVLPARHGSRNLLQDDRLAEYGAPKDVSNLVEATADREGVRREKGVRFRSGSSTFASA